MTSSPVSGPTTSFYLKMVTIIILCSVTIVSCTGSGDGVATAVVDGCGLVHSTNMTNTMNLTINVNTSSTLIHFTNCAIPPNMDIVVSIAQQVSNTQLSIVNTTMQGGSLKIIPATPTNSTSNQQALLPLLHNIHIIVQNSTLHGSEDMLLVTTSQPNQTAILDATHSRSPLIENVTIRLKNTIITSERGSVASIAVGDHSGLNDFGGVKNVEIIVGGNTTLIALFLVASVRTSHLKGGRLLVDSCWSIDHTTMEPDCCESSPVKLVAGGEVDHVEDGHVGVLSVLPVVDPSGNGKATLRLEDVEIMVTDVNAFRSNVERSTTPTTKQLVANITMEARVDEGSAAVAGVALHHNYHVELTVSGNMTIDITLAAPSETPVEHDGSHSSNYHKLLAVVTKSHSAATVGGIVSLAADGAPSNTTVLMASCALRLSFSMVHFSQNDHDRPAANCVVQLNASVARGSSITATSVLGLALNSQSMGSATTTFTMEKSSTLSILTSSFWIPDAERCSGPPDDRTRGISCSNVTMATQANSFVATTIMGVSLNSKARNGFTKSTVTVGDQSVISIFKDETTRTAPNSSLESFVAQQQVNESLNAAGGGGKRKELRMATTALNYVASSILGIAVNCFSNFGPAATTFSVLDGSNITMMFSSLWSGGGPAVLVDTTIMISRSNSYVASAVLGMAMSSYSLNADAATSFTAQNTSTLTFALANNNNGTSSSSPSSRLNITSSNDLTFFASAIFGLALSSDSNAGTTSVTLVVNDSSTIVMLTSVNATTTSGNVALVSQGTSAVAEALFGIALNGFSTKSSTSLTVLRGSSLTIASSWASSSDDISHFVVKSSRDRVARYISSAVLGVAVKSYPGTSIVRIGNSCKVSINALLSNAHVLAAAGERSAAAAAGIALFDLGRQTTLELLPEKHEGITCTICPDIISNNPLGIVFDIWVGALRGSELDVSHACPSSSSHFCTTAAVGIKVDKLSGILPMATAIGYCSGNTTTPTTSSSSADSVTIGIQPTTTPTPSPNITIPWLPHNHGTHTWCDLRAHALHRFISCALPPQQWQRPWIYPFSPPGAQGGRSRTSTMSTRVSPTASSDALYSTTLRRSTKAVVPPRNISNSSSSTFDSEPSATLQHTPSPTLNGSPSSPTSTLTFSVSPPLEPSPATAPPTTLSPAPTTNTTTAPDPPPDPVQQQKTTVTVVSSTVLVTSAVNSGGPGLQDVQALVVLGSMACASEEVRTVSSGGDKSVVPFELPLLEEGSRSRTLLSNVVLLLGFVLLHALAALVLKLKSSGSGNKKRFVECCGAVRFPAWSFSAFVLLYQGTVLTAFRALFSPAASTDRVLGGVLVAVCFALPCVGPVLRVRGRWPATFVRYKHTFASVPMLLRVAVFPTGFYDGSKGVDPDCIVRRFSTLFTSVTGGCEHEDEPQQHNHPAFAALGFGKAFVVALVAALPPSSLGCTTRFAVLGVVSLAVALLVAWRRPWRVSLNNALSCLTNVCTAVLCFSSVQPDGAVSERSVSTVVTATVGLGMVTSVSGVVMKVLEFTKWKKEERRLRAADELSVPMLDVVSKTLLPQRHDSIGEVTTRFPVVKESVAAKKSVNNPLLTTEVPPDSPSDSRSSTFSSSCDDEDV